MAKQIGYGTALAYSTNTTTPVYTTLAFVSNIEGPTGETEEVDATTLDGSTDKYREFLSGLKDPGELTFDLVYDPQTASHQKIQEFKNTGATNAWKITLPVTSATCTFNGWVRNFNPSFVADDAIRAACTVRVSGGITWPTTV